MEDDSYTTEPPPLLSTTALTIFPLILAAAWFLDFIGLGLLMHGTIHEFGHATAAWLCGRWAILVPIVLTWISPARSTTATCLAAGALLILLWRAWTKGRYGLLLLSTLALLSMLAIFFSWTDAQAETAIIYSGIAGEMALPALCAVLYFCDVSPRLRWDFWRYPLLLMAACCWLYSASIWSGVPIGLIGWNTDPQQERIAHDPQAYLDWLSDGAGASSLGSNDSDIHRLVHDYHWSTKQLACHYRGIAAGSAIVMLLALLYGTLAAALKPSPRV